MIKAPITPIDVEIADMPKRDRNTPPGQSDVPDKPGWKIDKEQAENPDAEAS